MWENVVVVLDLDDLAIYTQTHNGFPIDIDHSIQAH